MQKKLVFGSSKTKIFRKRVFNFMKPILYSRQQVENYLEMGYWSPAVLTDYWEKNAERHPDREALVDTLGNRLTFAQVTTQVDNLALQLIELGLERDDRVAIQLPNRVEGFLARLACEKAGLISIALMHTFRHAELLEILGHTETRAIVIPMEFRRFSYYEMVHQIATQLPHLKHIIVAGDKVPEKAIPLSRMLQSPPGKKDFSEVPPGRKISAFDVGFLSSTTGTTGPPKIVERTFAAYLCGSRAHLNNWKITAEDILCAVAPFPGAPGGTPTYFCAPMVGAKVVLLHEYNPIEALKTLEKEKATVPCLVPAQLAAIMQESVEGYDLRALRFIHCSGGYLPPSLAEEAERRMKCPILVAYGSQDTGMISGTSTEDLPVKRHTTVGRPLAGNEIKLLDDDGKEVPHGEVGQLYFRGPQNSSGYYRDPEKTFSEAVDSEGWATPGDLVRFDEDGYLVITGRKKDIIIRGGQNIYPGEVESLLIAHPKVSDAAIVAMPDPIMGEKACAFVILVSGNETFTFAEMTDYLESKRLARYKLPERLEILDFFPLAGDSKINKKKLREIIAEKLQKEVCL